MRKIREVLRLKYECGLSYRGIAASTGMSHCSIHEYVRRAAEVGLTWELARELDDGAVEDRLFHDGGRSTPAERAPIDLEWVHRELRRTGVTLQLLWCEYRDAVTQASGKAPAMRSGPETNVITILITLGGASPIGHVAAVTCDIPPVRFAVIGVVAAHHAVVAPVLVTWARDRGRIRSDSSNIRGPFRRCAVGFVRDSARVIVDFGLFDCLDVVPDVERLQLGFVVRGVARRQGERDEGECDCERDDVSHGPKMPPVVGG